MKIGFLLCFFCIISAGLYAQQTIAVRGVVTDTAGIGLPNASLKIRSGKDSLFTLSGKEGVFLLRGILRNQFQLEISMIGFSAFSKSYTIKATDTEINIGRISLDPQISELDGVVVIATTPIKVMEDTVQYAVSAFKVREGAPAEDVIKKLPGMTVDKDGNITSQGKAVSRIRVNGKDFFGGDVKTATQNLPAEILDNIQVIEDYGDQANLTGVKLGEPETIININIKKDKNVGNFGNLSAAGGTQERYVLGGMMNIFRNERQISVIASMNNTNASTFNFNGGGKGGGARGGNFGSSERGGFGGNGLTNAQSAGINYRDKWGENISVYGSYSFSGRSTSIENTSQTQDINPQNSRLTSSLRSSDSKSTNHRVTFNLEYKVDTTNYLKISPYVSFSQSSGASTGVSIINRAQYYSLNDGKSGNNSSAPNAGGSLVYNHAFRKKGRNVNVTGSMDYSQRSQKNTSLNKYRNVDSLYLPPAVKDTIQQMLSELDNNNTRSIMRASYAEPLGNSKTTFIEANYEWNKSSTNNTKAVFDYLPGTVDSKFNISQSNNFEYQFITNRFGFNLRGNQKRYNYTIGIVAQPSVLKGQSVGKDIFTSYTHLNWIPTARFVYNFGKSHTLTAVYDSRSREPNFMQLQPVADSSNLNNIVIGNPDLNAEFNSNFSVRYNKFDRASGRSFFSNLVYDLTNNKIVNNRVNSTTGTGRTTSYLNTNGFYRVSGDGSFTQPFYNRKFTATINLAASYDNNISYTDNQRNKGRNWNVKPGAVIRLDIENIVDLNLNANYTFYKTTTQYSTYTNTNSARTLQFGLSGKNYFFKDLTLGYDVAKSVNYGFSRAASVDPLIINLYAEYRFLKGRKATIRLQGYDLMNENTGISRTIYETSITDSRSNRLARYVLLSFNMRLQKFGPGVKQPSSQRRQKAMGSGQ